MGFNQVEFGAIGGVGKLAQLKYEKGERTPSVDYLHAIGQHGADVDYLLFGVRAREIDVALLADVVAGIDEAMANAGITAPPARKARSIVNLYRFCNASSSARTILKTAASMMVSEWKP